MEGTIPTKVIVNAQNNMITYVVIGLAIFELLFVSAGIYICSRLRKMHRQHRNNGNNHDTQPTLRPSVRKSEKENKRQYFQYK